MRFLERSFWIQDPSPDLSLSDDMIRRALRPKVGVQAVAQAHYGAQALEPDRETTRQDDLRSDLMRQRRELKERLAGVELMLDELDAQDCLERRT